MTDTPPPILSPRWDTTTRRTIILVCLLLVAFIFAGVTNALPIIVVSWLLAFLLSPLASFIENKILFKPIKSRALAIVLTFVIVVLLMALVVWLVLPVLIDQVREFGQRLPRMLGSLESSIEQFLSQPIVLGDQEFIPINNLREAMGLAEDEPFQLFQLETINFGDAVNYAVRSLTGPAFSFIGGAFNAIINLVFLLTMMFYWMKDGATFRQNLINVTPENYQHDARRLLLELGKVWNAYLKGQIILSILMGVLVFIAATLLGVPNAPILGLLAGVLEFIPNLGPLLALIPAALLAASSQSATLPFLEGPVFALVVIAVWTGLQQLESIFLVPRIMGSSLNLHPFIIIVGVIAGVNLGGALGIILAAPMIATARVLG